MTIFSDDFNRANGSLGGNWTTIAGTPAIESNAVRGTGSSAAYNTTVSDTHYQDVNANITWTNSSFGGPGVGACIASDGTGGWFLKCYPVGGVAKLILVSGGYQQTTPTASYTLPSPIPPMFNIRLVWDDGEIACYYNGTSVMTASSGLHMGSPYMGLYVNGTYGTLLDITMISETAVAFAVSPDVIPNFGDTTELTFTGTNTSWTSGTPGSPTFTCNHGTLSSQSVGSATSATATYDPGDFLGTVTFTDPSTGETATALVTSDPQYLPDQSECPFTEDAVNMVNTTAANRTGDLLTGDTPVVLVQSPYQDIDILTAISQIWHGFYTLYGFPANPQGADVAINSIWRAINGGQIMPDQTYETNNDIPVKQDLGYIITNIDEIRGDPKKTIPDVLTAIAGISAPDLSAIRDDIGIEGQMTYASIVAMLTAMWGTSQPTLTDLADMVQALSTVAGYTLGDVLDAIAAIPGADLSGVMTKLDQIQPSTAITMTTLDTKLTTVDTVVDGIDADVTALRTGSNLDLQDVLDAIDALSSQLSGLQTGAPVWPGQSGVTLAASAPLSDGMTVTGPMHGLLFTITGAPPAAGKYAFGDVDSWQHVGGVIFQTDRGDYERAESFGLDAQLVTPKTMTQAAAAVIRLKAGFTGTVRAWSLS